mmetsp:Transcript_49194/g.105163  ORF Transcript_49194/g.105163 Transcript_49194/m.105163 type:complete len:211 (-) Transcript_49194:1823-2455(-)
MHLAPHLLGRAHIVDIAGGPSLPARVDDLLHQEQNSCREDVRSCRVTTNAMARSGAAKTLPVVHGVHSHLYDLLAHLRLGQVLANGEKKLARTLDPGLWRTTSLRPPILIAHQKEHPDPVLQRVRAQDPARVQVAQHPHVRLRTMPLSDRLNALFILVPFEHAAPAEELLERVIALLDDACGEGREAADAPGFRAPGASPRTTASIATMR